MDLKKHQNENLFQCRNLSIFLRTYVVIFNLQVQVNSLECNPLSSN